MSLVLASASPRREALLKAAGFAFAIRPSSILEHPGAGELPIAMARRLATEKAASVHDENQNTLGADTVVHVDGELFGKPLDPHHSAWMLGRLSGQWHQVTSAFAVMGSRSRRGGTTLRIGHATTRVLFRALSEPDIARYLATGEGSDKAGAYAIQGLGGALIDRVMGSYTNVVGLPLSAVIRALKSVGVRPDVDRGESPTGP